MTNINIGHLLINREGYHKNETCSRNHLKFQHEFFFQLFWLHAYEKCFCHKPISQLARISLTLFKSWFNWKGLGHVRDLNSAVMAAKGGLKNVREVSKFNISYSRGKGQIWSPPLIYIQIIHKSDSCHILVWSLSFGNCGRERSNVIQF